MTAFTPYKMGLVLFSPIFDVWENGENEFFGVQKPIDTAKAKHNLRDDKYFILICSFSPFSLRVKKGENVKTLVNTCLDSAVFPFSPFSPPTQDNY